MYIIKKEEKICLLLFSGGLDSILAAKIMEKQGTRVMALVFTSYFFDARQARKSARENGINLRVEDISKEHFEVVKKPRFGRGAGMNPCVDCHLLMLRVAKKIAEKEGFDIIATGEVLGQRPMSQNRQALELIEKEAGLSGKILRPLSEKILNPRAKLLEGMHGISGRSRSGQMELARKYKIKYYPTPAGGCILTDKEYSKKLQKLLDNIKNIKSSDLELLRLGRHFWAGKTRIILGRNHEENLKLKKLKDKQDIVLGLKSNRGPLALVRGPKTKKALETARQKILYYGRKKLEEGGKELVEY